MGKSSLNCHSILHPQLMESNADYQGQSELLRNCKTAALALASGSAGLLLAVLKKPCFSSPERNIYPFFLELALISSQISFSIS